jgi:hypothetical protein
LPKSSVAAAVMSTPHMSTGSRPQQRTTLAQSVRKRATGGSSATTGRD